MFTKGSRYFDLPDRAWLGPDGREVLYKSRRILPRGPVRQSGMTVVAQSERLDLVANRTVGSPDLFWRLCDANGAMNPFDLVEPSGKILRVPEM